MLQNAEGEATRRSAAGAARMSAQRQAILDAALLLFDRDGFDRTTMKAIAGLCGMTDAGLYYHFPSKRAILDAIWEFPIDEDALSATSAVLGRDDLIAFIDRMLDFVGRTHSLVKLTTRQLLNGDPSALQRRERVREVWRRGLASHFDQVLDPERAAVCSEAAAILLLGAVFPIMFNPRVDLLAALNNRDFRDHVKQLLTAVLPADFDSSPAIACAP